MNFNTGRFGGAGIPRDPKLPWGQSPWGGTTAGLDLSSGGSMPGGGTYGKDGFVDYLGNPSHISVGNGADSPPTAPIQGGTTTATPPKLMDALFNVPVYQRNRMNAQQGGEMQGRIDDQFRRDTQRLATELDRNFTVAKNTADMNRLSTSTNAAMNAYDALEGQRRQSEMDQMQGVQGGLSLLRALFPSGF